MTTRLGWLQPARHVAGALLALSLVLVANSVSSIDDSTTFATYQIRPGWATFGLTLPQGTATSGVRVGSLATQIDVKTLWPDGSVRFAVVTAKATTSGFYPVTAGSSAAGSFSPASPEVVVRLVIDGQEWIAALPYGASPDRWLSGPLVVDARSIVAPMANKRPHPFLRVVFDVRSYVDGAARVDVTVQNTLDVPEANAVTYDVTVAVDNNQVFAQRSVSHGYLTRWRRTWPARGLLEAEITPDFLPSVRARAVPRFRSTTVAVPEVSLAEPRYGILEVGDLHVPMDDHGGRPEIAPYPDWTARYLVHRRPDERDYVLRHGDLAGSWATHVTEADGVTPISIDKYPNYWLDYDARYARGQVPRHGPHNNMTGVATSRRADNAHQPSLVYVPYLLTGDRYYADELRFWANFCLLSTFQDRYYNERNGSEGLLKGNAVRAIGWTLRTVGDAAAYLPDADPWRSYFRQKVENNLAYLDRYARTALEPLGVLFWDKFPGEGDDRAHFYVKPWAMNYVAWAIDHLAGHGFAGGTTLRDEIVRFQLALFTSDAKGYERVNAGPYRIAMGSLAANGTDYVSFRTWREVSLTTAQDTTENLVPFVGWYGVDARLSLLIAQRLNLPGAEEGLTFLMSQTSRGGTTMEQDVDRRAGWAIEEPSAPAVAGHTR